MRLSCKKAWASRWMGLAWFPRRLPLALRPILICVELSAPVTLTLTRGAVREQREAPRASLQLRSPGAPVGLKSSSPLNCCGTGVTRKTGEQLHL